ncbi:MAG TPA: STN domain-containing protein, partial [Rhizomicrobium sp.]|nr:STN domain-containing protein [Rhizomicrobium sp.]
MSKRTPFKSILLASAGTLLFANAAAAGAFDVPGGDLKSALKAYSVQSGIPVVVSDETVKGISTTGVRGDLSSSDALSRILSGTGFTASHDPSGVIAIVPRRASSNANVLTQMQLAQAAPVNSHAVETVTVTSSKLGGGDV